MVNKSTEKRNLFRIKDNVMISFRQVSTADSRKHPASYFFPSSSGLELIKELYALDESGASILRALSDDNSHISSYLKMINKKIDLLARTLVADETNSEDNLQENISLSEGGIAFQAPNVLTKGDLVVLKLVMLPTYLGLMLYARVVDCHALQDSNQNHISASFLAPTEQEARILARHIMQVQSTQLRLSKLQGRDR